MESSYHIRSMVDTEGAVEIASQRADGEVRRDGSGGVRAWKI